MERFLKNSGQKKMKRLFYQEMCNGKKVTPGVTSLVDRLMVSSVVSRVRWRDVYCTDIRAPLPTDTNAYAATLPQ